jgi:hypothetical protein
MDQVHDRVLLKAARSYLDLLEEVAERPGILPQPGPFIAAELQPATREPQQVGEVGPLVQLAKAVPGNPRLHCLGQVVGDRGWIGQTSKYPLDLQPLGGCRRLRVL